MRRSFTMAALGILFFAMIGGCVTESRKPWTELAPDPEWHVVSTFHLVGKVQQCRAVGGPRCFNLRDENGKTYEPVNLPEAFKVDGRHIEAKAQLLDNMVSVTMTGQGIQILRIR